MEGNITIYVAGNPDAYPIEYYNPDTGEFDGVIPQLLREFSAEGNYEIQYYQPGREDKRESLGKNHQVDILSGYLLEEEPTESREGTVVFSAEQDGKEVSYCLYFTKAAPGQFQQDLTGYISTVSQEEVTGLLLEQSAAVPQSDGLLWAAGGFAVLAALLAAVLAFLVRKYRKKLKTARTEVETDAVTGLGNIDYLNRYYKQYVNDKNRILYKLFYFYVDVDRLLRVSGTAETDEFLRYCAVVLQEYTGDRDILARVSDHGFVMVRQGGDMERLHGWVSTVLERIRAYARIYGKPFDVDMSVGSYAFKQGDRDLAEVIFTASQGAYEAHRSGAGCIFCSDQMMEQFVRERQLQASLEQAFANHEFQLYLQFYVDAESEKTVGAEALSRWLHPQRGLLNPSVFVPLMERENLISRLDYYCLREACVFLQGLAEKQVDTFFISCNFSRETFGAADFVERAKEIVEEFDFPRELLIFEITESARGQNGSQIRQNITALKEYGVQVVLDDFGEGFTSFYDLHKYPIDGIKLDKGLIDHMMTTSGLAILKAMIQVGHELDMTILAEGVESKEQAKLLREMHCDVIQGFYFHYPLPEWEARKEILNH